MTSGELRRAGQLRVLTESWQRVRLSETQGWHVHRFSCTLSGCFAPIQLQLARCIIPLLPYDSACWILSPVDSMNEYSFPA
jgi:hypothetical protein